jgi:phosphomevalonate kinase
MIGTVLAPGKAILCGEYAVLHGAPAVSVAVDRCVRGWIRPGEGTALSPFLTAALEHTAKALGRPDLMQSGQLGVDSKALYDGNQKIGLGSSAAVTVAAVGAALVEAGQPLHDKRRIFELADEAHAAAQGTRGSGIDVATSVWGGALRFERKNGKAVITQTDLPDDVYLTFVFTGTAASTPAFIGKVKALAESKPDRHQAAIGRLISLSHAFCAAFADREAEALIRTAGEYGDAMKQLGEAAGADIVTDAHQRIAAIARRHGGAAKPSGAGGGDLGVAFTRGPTATGALRADLIAAGLSPLALAAPAPGLRLGPSGAAGGAERSETMETT